MSQGEDISRFITKKEVVNAPTPLQKLNELKEKMQATVTYDFTRDTCTASMQFDSKDNAPLHVSCQRKGNKKYLEHKLAMLLLRAASNNLDGENKTWALSALRKLEKNRSFFFGVPVDMEESDEIEFKGSKIEKRICPLSSDQAASIKNIEETVGAFINSNGGSIFIGVCNNGEVCGIQEGDADKLVLRMQGKIFDKLEPREADKFVSVSYYNVGFYSGLLGWRPDGRPADPCQYTIKLENLIDELEPYVRLPPAETPLIVLEIHVQKSPFLVMTCGKFYKRLNRQNRLLTYTEIQNYFCNELKK